MNITRKIKLHSLHITILLTLSLIFGSLGVGLLIQSNPLIKSFDDNFYRMIHDGYHAVWIDLLIKPFNYNFLPDNLSPARMPSYYYFMMLLSLIYLYFFKRSLVLWAIFCFLFGTILAQIISALDWHFIFRVRPFYNLPNSVDDVGRAAWGQLSSYPSGHARETALYCTIIAYFIPKLKWAALIFVLFIAYSRVYIGAHFPTDVLAGIIIGFIAAKVTLTVAKELQLIFDRRRKTSTGSKIKQDKKDVQQK